MKKIYLFLTILIALSLNLTAQYVTPGTGVDWTFDDLVTNSGGAVIESSGVYFVNEELTISTGDILTIDNGIEVKIAADILISVNGTWDATPDEQAVFTAIDPESRFKGFRFEESVASVIDNCLVEYGGGIKMVDCDVQISNSVIRYFDKGYSTGAIDLYHSSPDIYENEIYENAGPAIASGSTAASSPQILNNNIYENNTSNANTPQINLGTMADDSIRIVGNTISGLYEMAGGIAVTTLMGGEIECVIKDNLIQNNRYGVTCYGSNISAVITNNEIHDNNIDGNPDTGGSGLNFYGGATNTAIVSYNKITGNLWGITIQSDAQPNMGQLEGDIYNEGMNEIYDNGNNNLEYNLYNNTPNPIMAENNYWGVDNADDAEGVIFHEPDDGSLGFIDYLPILTGGVNVDNLGAKQNDIITAVFPVPASNQITIDLERKAAVKIYSSNGALMLDKQFAKGETMLQTSNWPAGLYTIVVANDHKRKTRTILIAR